MFLNSVLKLIFFSVGGGGWSSEGIQVISNITRDGVTTVQYNSTYLTSFAVLVDVTREGEVHANLPLLYTL